MNPAYAAIALNPSKGWGLCFYWYLPGTHQLGAVVVLSTGDTSVVGNSSLCENIDVMEISVVTSCVVTVLSSADSHVSSVPSETIFKCYLYDLERLNIFQSQKWLFSLSYFYYRPLSLAKQWDNGHGRVCPSVCLSALSAWTAKANNYPQVWKQK